MIPIVLVTGFLGSGKTTLLNRVMARRAARGETRRLALVVNELGEVGIDGTLLPADMARQVELPGGCICCVRSDDLDATLLELVASNPGLEAIVIETTGVAEPLPISWSLERAPLSEQVRLAVVVTLVDATAFAASRPLTTAVEAQVEYADVAIVTKSELVDGATLDAVRAAVTELAPRAPLLVATPDEAAAWLEGVLADPPVERVAGPPGVVHHENDGHDHGPGHAHGIDSVWTPIHDLLDLEELIDALEELPAAFVRVKGIARVVDGRTGSTEPHFAAFHRVGLRVSTEPPGPCDRTRWSGRWPGRRAWTWRDGGAARRMRRARRAIVVVFSSSESGCRAMAVEDPPKAHTLHELLLEMKRGYVLHKPILIELEPGSRVSPDITIDRTMTIKQPLDWVEEYGRELGNNAFLVLGPNTLSAGLDQPVTIGRSRRCDVRIENDSVSKVHGSVVYDPGTGEYFIIDENSRNGTRINGEPLTPGVPAAVWAGAHVAFGDALYVFLDPPTLRKLAKLAV